MSVTYETRRDELLAYFDRTAFEAWEKLTSDAPVSKIRETVRKGRDEMRDSLLSWLPEDLEGARILDAGCGTGALATELAIRGADVVAIDLSPKLVRLAEDRLGALNLPGSIDFRAGDMFDPSLGRFDHVVAMDSMIHYPRLPLINQLSGLSRRTKGSLLFTFAPRTQALALMHTVGKLFPRGNRAPAIEPIAESKLVRAIDQERTMPSWQPSRTHRVESGFYISQALELVKR